MNYPVIIEALKGKCTFLDITTGLPVVDGKGRPQINRDYPVADGSEYVSTTVIVLEQVEPTKPEITDIQRLTRGEWVYDQAAQTATRPYVVVDLTAEEIAALNPVPESVQSHQLFTALSRSGIAESTIEAVVDEMPEGQAKVESDIAIRRAPTIRRDHPIAQGIAAALGLTSEQVDEMFRLANTI